ncbi:MAG: small multi-drug export protein [Bacillus sp. (in: Bacteria)]|nr:small multi-drug export protein [Bacillus sp. (in: firmicutes)]MCM1426868.1 small multi-drug export protein [Eubacterium sp.]
MNALAAWFANTLGKYVSKEIVIFIISMIPILELRGGLLVSKLLEVSILTAIPICIIGNIIPIPFILLFIKQIFKWLKKIKIFKGLIEKLENRAMGKSESIKKYEFWGLVLFVGIPLPGTGAWTGSLIAALLEIDFKKAILAELLGIAIATVIMSIVSYGLLGALIS